MKKYEYRIESLKKEKEHKMSLIVASEDRIEAIDSEIAKLTELQSQLPERHQFPWDDNEKENLRKATMHFIQGMAKNHKRTPIAIAARIVSEKWLLDVSNAKDV